MGCCLSKTDSCSKHVPNDIEKPKQNDVKISTLHNNVRVPAEVEENKKEEEEKVVTETVTVSKKKELFVIQHRKSNDGRQESSGSGSGSSDPESVGRNLMAAAASGQVVRTSSCTKEEVDAILIQCGRLSRSSSGKGNAGHGRRYSGSKRSFDFERENEGNGEEVAVEEEEEDGEEGRVRRRESRGSNRRRTTPSRSRERVDQRSGSRERSGGRRVSRSPGRRSDSPMSHSGTIGTANNGGSSGRPGKLVSVPATVTSLSIDKGNNGSGGDGGNVKRVLVKRNVGSPRSQSPAQGNGNGNGRSQSPAKGNGRSQSPGKGNQVSGQQGGSLSRNGSRKAEHSPYRRTPLNEIDINSLPFQPLANKRPLNKGKEIEEEVGVVKQPNNSVSQNKYATETLGGKAAAQGGHRRTRSRGAEGYEVTKTNYCRVNGLHTPSLDQMAGDNREQLDAVEYDAMVTPVILSGTDTLKLPQTLVRSRSSRRSRDFDINVDALLTPTPATNYTSLLLQDIQNFHQNKNPNSNSNVSLNTKTNTVTSNNGESTPYTLPPCVGKACSIVEAVADLNSTTKPGAEKASRPDTNFSFDTNKKRFDPFVESEVKVGDDLMEPSLHKYVTVRRRGGDMDDEESSGSNSIVGGGSQQNWVSSSSWEPNSAESVDCWTSKSYTREDEFSPAGGIIEDSGNKFSRNGRVLQSAPQQQSGATRSRTGPITTSKTAASM
ncbi:hypothetical protein RND81_09G207900 [Saponaria officinalis]|uniref:Uncharacterized protein n=1 Tax=Saponaria officinalis TaxID=3572 RepID=A0AAW1INJ7_SAPOF